MAVDAEFWKGRRVLLTGHTGFKGSWLSLWLQQMGAELHGLALEPATEPALFRAARVREGLASSTIGDIRDYELVAAAFDRARPEIVIHMAAQPLVRQSYLEPVATYATNVMGVVHVLEAARRIGAVRSIVNVTTDKCYQNREWVWGYREDEPMGGHDPYSSSKGCAELVTSAYRASFMRAAGIALASARAGNVIGGGDWAPDRLIPDILRAFEKGEPVIIRSPKSTRPWQHVLEPLSGYLELAQRLYADADAFADGWNFGPDDSDARPVDWIVDSMIDKWGSGRVQIDANEHPHEAHDLKLDISKARIRLGWTPRWSLDTALEKIVAWHRSWLAGDDPREACLRQISEFVHTPKIEGALTDHG
ncbi:CDP-glucose 4,6-dehydratase [Methylosinus sp. Ce-a6]|uniref:CDP-glucose 4,6-dehydratase n=1 Tax=Methylosinus sp. Ce-a6 TaxID=2172005 RepID=UPI00135889DD|nr:CDP-glucose 4,6-dehydratase [Methylosinus sp. Ce-a6]